MIRAYYPWPGVWTKLNLKTKDQKLKIATMLDEFGVDFIEAGHPAVSPDIARAVKEISEMGLKAKVVAHSRSMRSDIDEILKTNAKWVGIFFSVSDKRLESHFRKNLDEALGLVGDVVSYAKNHGLKVRYTPEDTIRSPLDNVIRVSRAAVSAGADRISVADTVGAGTPQKVHNFVWALKQNVQVPLHIHCHNDLGLALANSLAAFEAGASVIDTCVNGLGERTGITDLSQLVLALRTHYGVEKDWKYSMLTSLSEKVENCSNMKVSPQAPIVGSNAFRHNAGLHVSGVFANPEHYEVFPAELIGRKREFHLDKMAGKHHLEFHAREKGITLGEEQKNRMLAHLKSLEKGHATFEELLEL